MEELKIMEDEITLRRRNVNKSKENDKKEENTKEVTENNSVKNKRLKRQLKDEPDDLKKEIITNEIKTTLKSDNSINIKSNDILKKFTINIEIDLVTIFLFVGSVFTRFYNLSQPKNVV